MTRTLYVIIALAFCVKTEAQVVINEIMQSNIDCIMDDLNDFPDSWVELYNAGNSSVNLADYRLGETKDAASAWALPKYSLAPGKYRLVYCDKVGKDWHTPYRLESGKGCTLYLFKGEEIVDQLPDGMKKQPAPNIAYGRETDGSNKWGYQLVATPGEANDSEVVDNKKILGDPVLSESGCVLNENKTIRLKLSLPDDAPEGTVIRYTEDGSEPTESSQLYSSVIRFNSTKIIRAKLFCDGYLSPRSLTQSYIMMDRDVTMPVISIATDDRYFYDDKIGIYVDGNYSNNKKNYENDWRRPINFEYFVDDLKKSELNQLGETRITGAASRGHKLKSLGIYANKRFGEKRFSYEFFPDQRPGKTEYKSMMLRNAGNDFDYLYK